MTDKEKEPDTIESELQRMQQREPRSTAEEIPAKERAWLELSEPYEALNAAAEKPEKFARKLQDSIDLAKERPHDRTLPRAPKTIAKRKIQIEEFHEKAQGIAEEALTLKPELDRLGAQKASSGEGTVADNAEYYRGEFVAARIVAAEVDAEISRRREIQLRGNAFMAELLPADSENFTGGDPLTMPYAGKGTAKEALQWGEEASNAANEELRLAYKRGAELSLSSADIQHARINSFDPVAHEISNEVDRLNDGKPPKGTLALEHTLLYEGPRQLGEQPPEHVPSEKDAAAEKDRRFQANLERERGKAKGPALGLGLGGMRMQMLPPEDSRDADDVVSTAKAILKDGLGDDDASTPPGTGPGKRGPRQR